ncbi:MAG: helix-turn-helix transcriptional regulator [Euryarchaeota archaeon]|nr:helix-turn-helix transcriptional regulator [Euryarchaeota archaeon]
MEDLKSLVDEVIRRLEIIKEGLDKATSVEKTVELPKESMLESVDVPRVSKVLSAIAHKDRVRILINLHPEGKYFTELKETTGLTNSALYFHLRVLQEAKIVEQEYSRGKYVLTGLGRTLIEVIWQINKILSR